jgi:phosphotransacetylase
MGGAHVPHAKYEKLIAHAKELPPVTTIVAHPCDETSLRGATEAAEAGIIVPILVGPLAKIASAAKTHGLDISRFDIVDAPHSHAAADKAVQLIREGKGELWMSQGAEIAGGASSWPRRSQANYTRVLQGSFLRSASSCTS